MIGFAPHVRPTIAASPPPVRLPLPDGHNALRCPQCPAPEEDVAHFLFHCPLYTTLRNHFADLFPPSISTPQAWLAQPACARIVQYLSQCYELHLHTLLPPLSPVRPLLASRGL